MHTQEKIAGQLRALGIQPTDTLTVHTSLKAIGPMEGGGEAFIETLRQTVRDGILTIPAHTWGFIYDTKVFDVRNSVPNIGTLPWLAVQMANRAVDAGDVTCRRSLHPSHSVVAFGKDAMAYVEDDAHETITMPMSGSYGKMYTGGGKILLAGVDLTKNTFIHLVDQFMRPDDNQQPHVMTVIDYDGTQFPRTITNTKGNSDFYELYRPLLEKAGALTYGKLGDGNAILCDAVKVYDAIYSQPVLVYPEK